jgi:DNA-binding transcriptional ArsR family regulator
MADGTENGTTLDELDANILLVKLISEVHKLNQKLDSAVELGWKMLKTQEEFLQRITKQDHTDKPFKLEPDMITLFSLPSALRKTVMALYKLGEATAEDLAQETKRLRAVESSAANQLVRMGLLTKRREGRKVYFYIN